MATEITVPEIGESITEGTIGAWLKKDGDFVENMEPLFELESDKATTEVPSPVSGTLSIKVEEGETVSIGGVVALIEEKEENAKQKSSKGTDRDSEKQEEKTDKKKEESKGEEAIASPAARKLIADHNLSPSEIDGSGREGRIIKEDVLSFLQEENKKSSDTEPVEESSPGERSLPSPQAPELNTIREKRERMSGIRQRIAERLVEAQQTAAILTTYNEVDMSQVMALRTRYKEAFQKKHQVKLGILSFFIKAAAEALQTFPILNARVEGRDIVYPQYYNIGIAVSTDRGLMVPVLRDVEKLTFAEIEKEVAVLAQKAREGKISVNDLQGGTFTITNGGIFGSMLSAPILNPPQSGILGMHAIQDRPVAVNGEVVVRPMMYMALSYDHRIIDGRDAVQFLVRIKECVEAPERMVLGI